MTTDALIKSVSIEAMLQAREAIEERLASIHALVKEIDGIAQHAPGSRKLDHGEPAFAEAWPVIARQLAARTVVIYNSDFDLRLIRQSLRGGPRPGNGAFRAIEAE